MDRQVLIPLEEQAFWDSMKKLIHEVLSEWQTGKANEQESQLLKMREVCELFKVSRPTIYDWINTQRLPSIKINSRRYFKRADIEKLIKLPK